MRFILFLFFLVTIPELFAQAPKYSNEFLNIGVGARSLGMSKSNQASVNDVTAGYWNPAGLASMEKDIELGIMHLEYAHNIAKYDYLALATHLIDTQNVFALSVIRLGVDDILNTLDIYDDQGNLNYDNITRFSVADYAFILSFARQSVVKGLDVGGNAKVIHRIIGDFATAWGFGIDIGARYHYQNWRFGATVHDITSTFNAWSFNTDPLEATFDSTGNTLPQNSIELTLPQLSMGIGRNFHLFNKFSALAEINANVFFDGKRNELIKTNFASISPHAGLEINYNDIIFVRGGIGNIHQTKNFEGLHYTSNPTLGLGIHFLMFKLDYALSHFGNQSHPFFSHIFSLNIAFDQFKL